jgi:hypothetical protein
MQGITWEKDLNGWMDMVIDDKVTASYKPREHCWSVLFHRIDSDNEEMPRDVPEAQVRELMTMKHLLLKD